MGEPRAVGPWALHEHLGSGGMGSVWRATDESGRTAAVKLIRSDLRHDEDARRRFQREFDVARRVTSRRVAVPLDADLDAEPAYIAWEHILGETLQATVEAAGPLSAADAVTLARDLSEALRDLESAGITHRDVKPNNILLCGAGAVLIDLGVALVEDQTGLTTGGQVIGTPGWLTPEQLEGQRPTAASDVFNWACAVVFAATGRGPFGTDTLPKRMYRVAHGAPALNGLPAALVSSVEQALAKDPAARPSARRIAAELNAALDGSAPPLSAETAVDATVRLADVPATRALATAAAAAGDTPTEFSHPTARPPRRWSKLVAVPLAAVVAAGAGFALTRTSPDAPASAVAQPSPSHAAASAAPTVAPATAAEGSGARPSAAGRNDPASYYTSDGSAPALAPACSGAISLCLGNPIDRAVERLGTEDHRYDLADEVSRTWDLGAVTVSATSDSVGSITELDVGTRDGARASTPIEGVTVGLTTFRQFADAVGGPAFADVNHAERFASVSFGVFAGVEGHEVRQVSTSLDDTDREWDRVIEAGNDVDALLAILGGRTIDGFRVGYDDPSAAHLDNDATSTTTSSEDGTAGVPPQWVHDTLADVGYGYQLADGSTWDPGADLNVVTGSVAGTANGRGMHAFFFAAGHGYLGTDALENSQVVYISWRDSETVAIEYTLYRDGDPGCCPTGGAAVVRFRWDGVQLTALDEIPPTSGPVHR